MALLALGMLDRLDEIADPSSDANGVGLDIYKLPERIRRRGTRINTTPIQSKDAPNGTVDDEGTAF